MSSANLKTSSAENNSTATSRSDVLNGIALDGQCTESISLTNDGLMAILIKKTRRGLWQGNHSDIGASALIQFYI